MSSEPDTPPAPALTLRTAARTRTPGSHHYRAFVGDTQTYDIFSHMQFSLMTLLGLRQEHTLLDIGCGSLRAGKLFLMYFLPDRYFGIEPEQWLVEEGIDREIGASSSSASGRDSSSIATFSCASFGVSFDFIIAQSIFSHASAAADPALPRASAGRDEGPTRCSRRALSKATTTMPVTLGLSGNDPVSRGDHRAGRGRSRVGLSAARLVPHRRTSVVRVLRSRA